MRRKSASALAAIARLGADNLKSNLSKKIEISSLTSNSKTPFKALSLREVLLHRFADQAFGAALSMQSKNVISAATLTRGCMETFARTYEIHEYLSQSTDITKSAEIDSFLMDRLFGSRTGEDDMPKAVNILTTITKVDKLGIDFRKNYDRMSEIAHPNYAGGIGAFQRIDHENLTVHFGDKRISELNLRRVGHIQAGNLVAFEHYYNALGQSVRRINEAFDRPAENQD